MNEQEWVRLITKKLNDSLGSPSLLIEQGTKLPYAYEVFSFSDADKPHRKVMRYETDVLISERLLDVTTKPRVVIEAKIKSVTTHDAIIYSQKASAHKQVIPFLRYGIILGGRKHNPLPGRLFRHGVHFDFMQSFVDNEPTSSEWENFLRIVEDEIGYSKLFEEVLLNSRSRSRKRYTSLQKHFDLRPKENVNIVGRPKRI